MDRLSDAANDETDRYFVARTLADVRGRAFEILYIPLLASDSNVGANRISSLPSEHASLRSRRARSVRMHAQVRYSVLRSAKVLSDFGANLSPASMLELAHLLGQDPECPVEAHDYLFFGRLFPERPLALVLLRFGRAR